MVVFCYMSNINYLPMFNWRTLNYLPLLMIITNSSVNISVSVSMYLCGSVSPGKLYLNLLYCNPTEITIFYLGTQDLHMHIHTYIWKDTYLYLFYIHIHMHAHTYTHTHTNYEYNLLLFCILSCCG